MLQNALKPKKSFGQNFMMDQNINQKVVEAILGISKEKIPIVEIGAGLGSLTHHLLPIFEEVHAIERDRDLIPILKREFKDEIESKKLYIHEKDAVTFNLSLIFSKIKKGILVGNLPYHLTSSILLKTLESHSLLLGAVFIVQKEVALRIISKPHSKEYGLFSVILQIFFDIKIASYISKECFWPVPKVDSSIIVLSNKKSSLSVEKAHEFLCFVKKIFQKRRKKLSTILGKNLLPILISLKIDPDQRPEDLTPQMFLDIFNSI